MFTKETWRQDWLKSINELTSIDIQRNSWLDKNNTNPHWSFIEFIVCYFDDILEGKDYQHFILKGWITQKELESIKDWHKSLEGYESPNHNDYDHESILNDINWIQVVKQGVEAKRNLIQLINNEERKYLIDKIK